MGEFVELANRFGWSGPSLKSTNSPPGFSTEGDVAPGPLVQPHKQIPNNVQRHMREGCVE